MGQDLQVIGVGEVDPPSGDHGVSLLHPLDSGMDRGTIESLKLRKRGPWRQTPMLRANDVRKIADKLGQVLFADAAVIDPVIDRWPLDPEVGGHGRLGDTLQSDGLRDCGS